MTPPRNPLVTGETEETFEPESGVSIEGAARLIHIRDILAVQDPPRRARVRDCGDSPYRLDREQPRGSSAIKGGADQELFSRKDGDLVTVEGGKLKDGDRGARLRYRVKPVKTGLRRDDGSPLDSLVLEPALRIPKNTRTTLWWLVPAVRPLHSMLTRKQTYVDHKHETEPLPEGRGRGPRALGNDQGRGAGKRRPGIWAGTN